MTEISQLLLYPRKGMSGKGHTGVNLSGKGHTGVNLAVVVWEGAYRSESGGRCLGRGIQE